MLKILKICSLLILFLLLIYSVISSKLYMSVQLIITAILIGISINCFKKKERHQGMLYAVIAMCNLSILIQ
ncbi:uncharacterized protein SRCM101294_00009 [Bacillus amyloliquefaciens]|nr:uncharacterized protein SRCM101294_00009 [Bacillus amyloliquefaciens]